MNPREKKTKQSDGKFTRRSTTLSRPDHFEQRRTNVWCIRLGYYFREGLSSYQISHELNRGLVDPAEAVSAETVRTMIQKAGLPSPGLRRVILPLNLASWERDALQRHADERGITVHELLYRFVRQGLILAKPGQDLYDAVTDGAYD